MARRTLQRIAQEVQVTDYLDYRDYLQELYQRAKQETSPYSYQLFAEDLGFSATNVLRLVIAKKRRLATKSAQTIVESLELRRQHRKYFLSLVQYSNARGQAHKERLFLKMVQAKQEDILSHRDRERLDYCSEWYHPVMRELLRLEGSTSAEALAAKIYPHVSADKIRRSLALLESLGLIGRNPGTGELQQIQGSPIIWPSDATAGQLAITQYHQSFLDVAKEAVTVVPAHQREFNAITVGLSRETFTVLIGKIQALCAEAMALENQSDSPECVAQLNIQLFSLSRWEEGKE